MFLKFLNKQKDLELSIKNYIYELKNTSDEFSKAMDFWTTKGCNKKFLTEVKELHMAESNADDYKRIIEELMYSNALIPDSRGDILGMVESLDKLPRIEEKLLHFIRTRDLCIHPDITEKIQELKNLAISALNILYSGFETYFKTPEKIKEIDNQIDLIESKCDKLELKILDKVFKLDIEEIEKERLATVVESLSYLADQAEWTSNRLLLASIKRIM